MKNQVFDWGRFTLTLRREICENWRQLSLSLLAIYGALSAMMILGNIMTGGTSGGMEESLRASVVVGAFSFLSIIVASLSFHGLSTKTGRIAMFTSPSSMVEKFAANVLIYIVGFWVAFFLCAHLADFTRILVLSPFRDIDFLVPGPINFISEMGSSSNFISFVGFSDMGMWQAIFWLSLLASQVIYLLGSVVWPHLSFLKTFGLIYAIEMVLGVLLLLSVSIFSSLKEFGRWVYELVSSGDFFAYQMPWVILQLVVGGVLAWWCFKHKDVISQGIFK